MSDVIQMLEPPHLRVLHLRAKIATVNPPLPRDILPRVPQMRLRYKMHLQDLVVLPHRQIANRAAKLVLLLQHELPVLVEPPLEPVEHRLRIFDDRKHDVVLLLRRFRFLRRLRLVLLRRTPLLVFVEDLHPVPVQVVDARV